MKMKNNRAGFTLVEMLVAMTASMIVILGVSQFMISASNTYKEVDTQVRVQMDAQDTINSVTDMLMEGNNVSKRQMDDGSEFYAVYYNLGQRDSFGNLYNFSSANQRIFWLDQDTHNLYLFHTKSTSAFNDAKSSANTGKQLLAEGVSDFEIRIKDATATSDLTEDGLSAGGDKTLLEIYVKMNSAKIARGKKIKGFTYKATQSCYIRNPIVALP